MRIRSSSAALLLAGLLPAACTLTADDFDPRLVIARADGPDAGVAGPGLSPMRSNPIPPAELAAPAAECLGSSEISGCATTLAAPEDGADGAARTGRPRCDDGVQGPDETDVDCGGACEIPCGQGLGCQSDRDCESALYCPAQTHVCAAAECGDGALNGSETAVDCGGSCPGCPAGAACISDGDCATSACGEDSRCAPASCDDQRQNQDETDVDCGGSCSAACATGRGCSGPGDCASRVCGDAGCSGDVARCCQAPACDDGVQNGAEPALDCGDAGCGLCPLGRACGQDAHCSSQFCQAGFCRVQPCVDGVRDGGESDVDCGGACGACAPGLLCNVDSDCQSGACEQGRCCGGTLVDCTRCARRLADGLTCEFSTDPVVAGQCNAFLDCLANNPTACPVRHAEGCSVDPGGVCNHINFGGNSSPALILADSILGTAQCWF